MSEIYVECLVKSQTGIWGKFAQMLLVMLTVVFGLLTLMGFWPAFFAGLLTGVGAYFTWLHTNIEYEYLYLDRELTVDKVMAKTKRKRQAVFEVDRMEILAPIKSYHLDSYKNRTTKVTDYSSKIEEQPDSRYFLYYEGNKKVLLNPSPELVKAIKTVAPRKVFTD